MSKRTYSQMQSADLKTDDELLFYKCPIFKAGAQSPFEELLDGGLDMDKYAGDGRSILYLYFQHEYLSEDMHYIPYFITRGLTNFLSHTDMGAWFDPDQAISIPCTVRLVGNISFGCGKAELYALLKLLVMFESLGVAWCGRFDGPEVAELRSLGTSLAGQVFKQHEQHMHNPLSLQQCARVAVRKQLGSIRFRCRLAQLPIPSTIKSYVACEDMPDISPAYDFEALWSLSGSQSEFDWNLIQ